jgi:hypothetical protein
VPQSFQVSEATQTMTFAAIAGQVATNGVDLIATASSGLTVLFASTTPSVCTVSGAFASLIGVGNCTIEATQPGLNAQGHHEYAAVTPIVQTFAVGRATQIISYSPSGPLTAASTVNLVPVASSGLPVTLTSTTPSVCTISGTIATLLSYGVCTINASVGGNNEYFPATSSISFDIGHASQTITFAAIPSQVVGKPLTLSATASSGLAVIFTSTTQTVCTVSGTTASFLAAGTCAIQASQPGNAAYFGAMNVTRKFTVTQ